MDLRIPALATIINGVVLFPAFILSFVKFFLEASKTSIPASISMAYNTLIILSYLLSVVVILGYAFLAKKTHSPFLRNMSYITIISGAVQTLYSFYFEMYSRNFLIFFLIFFVTGISIVIFGVAVLSLKKYYGRIAEFLGVIYIIQGIVIASVVFTFFSALTGIATCVLEAILFLRVAKRLSQ